MVEVLALVMVVVVVVFVLVVVMFVAAMKVEDWCRRSVVLAAFTAS